MERRPQAPEVYNRPVPLLEPGVRFPDITLEDEEGRPTRLPEGELLVAFFHTECATSEMAWPYLGRIRRIAGTGPLGVLAVSQDGPGETREFARRSPERIPILYDPPPWKASEALGLQSVPQFVLIGENGRIREAATGFDRAKMEAYAGRAARLSGREIEPLFLPGETVASIRPG